MQRTRNTAFTLTGASVEVAIPRKHRISIFLTNTGTGNVTIAKGDSAAVAGSGILLTPNSAYFEANDAGFECWQGGVQVIGTSTVAVSETTEEGYGKQATEGW